MALVLSAGGMYAAWEVGVWKALRERFQFDLIVGTSAGAWNAWMIAGGISPDELTREWQDPASATIMQLGLQPRIPFGLTLAEVPRLRPLLVRGPDVTWRHLAATASIPMCFPPVEIEGKQYLDGGLLGALPTWAAEEMGATHAIAVNAINIFPFRLLRMVFQPRRPSPALKIFPIEPSEKLGPLRDGVVWSSSNIERWVEQGERDGNRAATSITM
jgi:NTE family protein